MKMKKNVLSETKLFHFHRMFKMIGGGGFKRTACPPPLWIRHCTVQKLGFDDTDTNILSIIAFSVTEFETAFCGLEFFGEFCFYRH